MNLRGAAISAGRWTALSAAGTALLQIAQLILLARLLEPRDFGDMAVAVSFTATLGVLADAGLSRAVVHFDRPEAGTLRALYWINVAAACLVGAAVWLSAPLLARLHDSATLESLLRLSSLAFPITSCAQLLRVMAEKELRFVVLARIELISAVAGFLGAWMGALHGWGAMALVAGTLVTASVNTVLTLLWVPHPCIPGARATLHGTRPYLGFGAWLLGDSFLAMAHRQADVFIGGMLMDSSRVGLYSVSRDLSLRIAMLVNPVVTRVGLPVMARVKEEPQRLAHIYLQTLRMTASVNFPAYALFFAFAPEISHLLLGPDWSDVTPLLRLMAAWGLVRSLGNPVGILLYAVGRARAAFLWNLGLLVAFVPALWIGARGGSPVHLAMAALGMQLAIFVPIWAALVKPSTRIGLRAYCAAFLPPLACASVAGIAGWCAAWPFDAPALRLAVGSLAACAIYPLLSARWNRPWFAAMREMITRPRGADQEAA